MTLSSLSTMRYRDYKNFASGQCYHLYNRGEGKQDIFLDDDDRRFFLMRLKEYLWPDKVQTKPSIGGYIRKPLPPGSFNLLAYCLMPNHFHLLIKQLTNLSISKLIARVCTSYSVYFNKKYERVGHVFQDQYKAVLVEHDSYLTWLSAYIHENPKVAGLVSNLEDYTWSSYKDYLGLRQGTLCNKNLF